MRLRFNKGINSIWYRNSLRFSYWKFLKSDIDITIILATQCSDLIRKMTSFHFLFRKFMPIIGEVIFYHPHDLPSLIECVNSVEIKRDPKLVQLVNYQQLPTEYDKAVFLHKFVIANWDKKSTLENYRKDKINYYLECVNLKPNATLEAVIYEIYKVSHANIDKFNEFKLAYIAEIEKPTKDHNTNLHPLVYALFFNQLCYRLPSTENQSIDSESLNILKSTIKWEIWGIYTYRHLLEDSNVSAHCKRIFETYGKLIKSQEDDAFLSTIKSYFIKLKLI